jgi:hypothetical protein
MQTFPTRSDSEPVHGLHSEHLRRLLYRLARLGPLVAAGQVAIVLAVIWAWRPDAPYWDEWETVDIVKSFDARAAEGGGTDNNTDLGGELSEPRRWGYPHRR